MIRKYSALGVSALLLLLAFAPAVWAQQLGSIAGTVTDTTGAAQPGATVKVRNLATNLRQSLTTQKSGSYTIFDLPIGTYEVTFSKTGFKTEVHTDILVNANRTATVNGVLQPGEVTTQVTVTATPLLNQTDTTNGYVLNSKIIQSTPLGTGSFTQLAILAPGVSADLLSGSGTNAGLGNQNIWANGQRNTSNSFAFNGVDATNVFNGKSSSSVSSSRLVSNTGESFLSGGDIQTNTSVYNAIGQGLPTPPPETIEEMHVITSMYDATQGANSGAHISVITKSGTNDFHGQLWEYHQTTGWNANRFFFNAGGVPRPALHRNAFGGDIGGPIIHNKLFFFGAYQGQRVSDAFAGSQEVPVPVDLTSDRSKAALAAVANADFGSSLSASDINDVAYNIMNAKLPNGQYLVPNPTITDVTTEGKLGYATVLEGTPAHIRADQAMGNIDYNFSQSDRLSGKYYYQRNPTETPFTASPDNASLLGFPMTLHAGSQVFSLDNTTILSPRMTWEQRFGFIRELAYGDTSQGFTPSSIGINLFGRTKFPEIYIDNMDSNFNALSVGPETNFANVGVFQNQFEGETSFNWSVGRHNLSWGFDWIRNQLNVINKNNEVARLTFANFPGFLTGTLCGPAHFCSGVDNTQFLNGTTNRYYRSNQAGAFIQDDVKLKSNLTLDIGLRWDWDGPLVEKNGMLTNFYPSQYSYNVASDTITNIGLVVAGNNKQFCGTKSSTCVSDSTLTGRQWGFGPRIGLAWSPSFIKNFVVRTGFGMYYDRGEFFTELSPSAGSGISGPFGVTVEEPFVIPFLAGPSATFANPFGTTPPPPPPGNLSDVAGLVPNAAQLIGRTTPYCIATNQYPNCAPLTFGGYDPHNTLPYSENWTLDLQWQPYNTLLLDLAYVGNHGVHETLPIPFNQARIATPQNPLLTGGPYEQIYSYGYNVPGLAAENVQTLVAGFKTGNVALRVPFLGYDPNSMYWRAEGISHYNALQFQVHKRLSHGLLIQGSYTWSHALDEGSGLQLFYNGNDPNNPATGYATSGFDRTHVFTVSYYYQLPNIVSPTRGFAGQLVNGWGFSGITVAESGQPYSVYDYHGSIASIYWGGGQDEITNPIIPIGGLGSTSTQVELQGTLGVNPNLPVLNAAAFGPVPTYEPGTNGVPPCDMSTTPPTCDYYENGYGTTGRNIFRGPFQTRFDFDIFKNFKLSERFTLRYDAQFFNLFNHPSFDTPRNDVNFNPFYRNPPIYGTTSTYHPCVPATGAFHCPSTGGLGFIQHTLGSPRFIQMALHLEF
jgi:Carboxypeptidase regulatory-like domain